MVECDPPQLEMVVPGCRTEAKRTVSGSDQKVNPRASKQFPSFWRLAAPPDSGVNLLLHSQAKYYTTSEAPSISSKMQQPVASQPAALNEKPQTQTYHAPYPNHGGGSAVAGGEQVYHTPAWFNVVRGFQIFLAFVIMGLSGWIIHGVLLNPTAFSLVCGLFTWIVCIYALVSEKVQSARQLYNIYAILALDALMVIFWLSSMAAGAHLRASFKYSVNIFGCYDDGSSIDAHTCLAGRDLEKRAAVANDAGLSVLSAIAGLSALEMLLFIASLVWLFMQWRKSRPAGPTPGAIEMNPGIQNGGAPQYQQQQQQAPQMQPQHTGQPMPQQQQQQTFVPSPASGYAQPQQTQPSPPQYGQQQMPYQQVPTPGPQGMYSQSTSPAPQGQYQAPAQPYNPNQQQFPQYPQQYPNQQ
ncbi:uncharacterized protein MKZ38_003395 [Zalerion maritima]|uniref:MARVEL domain-containing protein n=1 Tax=Zalerion maritima TaxID=339359 RepID=A0AAD5WQA2_9PEZI|nr:uncharacterized protein MKZ38_003395 [Zalerion maritima]